VVEYLNTGGQINIPLTQQQNQDAYNKAINYAYKQNPQQQAGFSLTETAWGIPYWAWGLGLAGLGVYAFKK